MNSLFGMSLRLRRLRRRIFIIVVAIAILYKAPFCLSVYQVRSLNYKFMELKCELTVWHDAFL